jgi:NAD(P)-dependent dehydrogenase (short-subunit alcohol dehydrogenase family)
MRPDTKGISFHAELPAGWQSKSGCKSHPPFTRRTLKEWAERGVTCNVVAVFGPGFPGSPLSEALVATFGHSDSDVSAGQVHRDYLRSRTVRVDAATALKLHPRLAARLEAEG